MTKAFSTHIQNMVMCSWCNAQEGQPCQTEVGRDRRQVHDVRIRKHRRQCVPCVYREVNS